jgi:polyhydroxybutyrate depolymerase
MLRTRARALVLSLASVLVAILLGGCSPTGPSPGARAGTTATGAGRAGAASPTRTVVPAGTTQHTLTVDGQPRTYLLHRPATVHASAALVVVLHGGVGSGRQAEQSYGWDALADRAGFLVAYPDGVRRTWNVGGGCCGPAGDTGTDDVGFVIAMTRQIAGSAPVDPARVYATGMSNGGMLAYRLGCDTKAFAAIGPVAATLLGPCPTPAPLSVIHIHGTEDRAIRYDGAPGKSISTVTIDGPSVPALNASWRAAQGCDPPRIERTALVTTSTATCHAGRQVRLITVAGAGHQWPGSTRTKGERLLRLDEPSTALDATAAIWSFFSQHRATAPSTRAVSQG